MPPEPSLFWIAPFIALLLAIAILPLLAPTQHFWERNRNKLLIAVGLALVTLAYYQLRGFGHAVGEHVSPPGIATVLSLLKHAVLLEYVPFMSLLFSLYVISGGICVGGDIPAHPRTNTAFLAVGAVLASFIGTTGASMLLIRPLLRTNAERKHVAHTVIFFIFIVSNIGGLLLPTGDPPLFLGYLRGVPFWWTLNLWLEWAITVGILLVVYYVWDTFAYRKETPADVARDETQVQKLSISGAGNVVLLAGVLAVTATINPNWPVPGTSWTPFLYCRELAQLVLVGLSLLLTAKTVREDNNFNYAAIVEVACLFIGIFICMQVPIEILKIRGSGLGLDTPARFFWATGGLSSFLDNAPTYMVFFETANSLTYAPGEGIQKLVTGEFIRKDLLAAISIGAVFMGANTYIGNGPNFMVKSIAEHSGIKMPSFFGYMVYSICILLPIFGLLTLVFLR